MKMPVKSRLAHAREILQARAKVALLEEKKRKLRQDQAAAKAALVALRKGQ